MQRWSAHPHIVQKNISLLNLMPFRRVGTVTHRLPGHPNNLHSGELAVPRLLEGIRLAYIKTNLPIPKEGASPFFNSPPPPQKNPTWWTWPVVYVLVGFLTWKGFSCSKNKIERASSYWSGGRVNQGHAASSFSMIHCCSLHRHEDQ